MKPLLLPLCLLSLPLQADWPTYQHDISRVGHTEEVLTTPLQPRWVHASPVAPELA